MESGRFYIFHGPDAFSQQAAVNEILAESSEDESTRELNTARFDGNKVTMSELIHACSVTPFLAERRIVIVENLLSHFEAKDRKTERQELLEFIAALPPFTTLLFLESSVLDKINPFLKLARRIAAGTSREYIVPKGASLQRWIRECIAEQGGTIEPAAVALLAQHAGESLHLLSHEVDKLLSYTSMTRAITAKDVGTLTPDSAELSIFRFIDALGTKDRDKGLELLRLKLNAGEEPLYLFAMIVRQYRFILQMKEMLEKGETVAKATSSLKLHPYAASKIAAQASKYASDRLEWIYEKLLQTDVEMKTSKINADAALEALVVDICS
ncbi:MAG: DNA polymerase III subunit delta [Chloroflexota bacterium]